MMSEVRTNERARSWPITQTFTECIVMSYCLLPPVNHHEQSDLFSYYNNNKSAKNYTHLDVNILAFAQFMDLKLWEFIL